MKDFQIETAQNISIRQRPASVGSRILAYLLDGAIVVCYVILMIFLIGILGQNNPFQWVFYTVMALPIMLYHLLFESMMNGQSPGKYLLKIRVVMANGSQPGISQYLLRWLLRLVDITFTYGGAAILTILVGGKGQRLGDIAAGTTVISEKANYSLADMIHTDIPESYVPKYPQVIALTDRQVQMIKQIRDEALRDGDFGIIKTLAAKTATTMDVQYDEKSLEFLNRVVMDYNFYTQNG